MTISESYKYHPYNWGDDDHDDVFAVKCRWVIVCDCWYGTDDEDDDYDYVGAVESRMIDRIHFLSILQLISLSI